MTEVQNWAIKGELILNCNCTVFCPCVVSLGKHPPTEGYCQAWLGVRIDYGYVGKEDLSGLNIGMVLDIPGNMGRGNWKVGAYIDERASEKAFEGLVDIFSGKLKGKDSFGNKYYESKSGKRWIIYKDEVNASKIPVEWYSWIHFTKNKIENNHELEKFSWQKPHQPNLTGTKSSYHPNKDDNKVIKKYKSWKN